jgi:hypothetical protein
VRIIACIQDPVVIQKILDHLKTKDERRKTKPADSSRCPKAGRRLDRYSADASVLVQPRMPLPGGTWQDTGCPPAWNGAEMAWSGEAISIHAPM